jgi:hypothetical protein
MPHVLHLITDAADPMAREVVTRQAAQTDLRVSVVLLHGSEPPDAVLPGRVFSLDGPDPAGASHHPRITHAQLLDLIFLADTVVTW